MLCDVCHCELRSSAAIHSIQSLSNVDCFAWRKRLLAMTGLWKTLEKSIKTLGKLVV